jgi:transposase
VSAARRSSEISSQLYSASRTARCIGDISTSFTPVYGDFRARSRRVSHIRRRGEERRACRRRTRARRWVVERATSWFNRCRKLLIRWENKPQNYLALVHFAAAIVVWRGLEG